ncbi:L-lactate dehydrogenase [Afipia sp. P52-10]|jgi:isopentenyl diphosphate isomerase/L-lactate dehydrogenase-like FMN-dependent dehydrogenase|uniref:alpha-hydroxy acid oxidase n=2 Tax=Pseudomonadota TaxID=1224 RepID=UPI0003DF204B|nr:alpha-hydroxy acid oxidase [Afipia sp. P52-10]ETR78167.1 L-lactate dehydrogenase [Afipia sp. P52-10]
MARLDDCYNIFDLRDAARKRLPKGVFEFFDRGTEDEVALANNRAAFERLKLKHRALVDMTHRTMATTLFGKPVSMPMAIAPTGVAGMCWYHGELELAKAAAAAKIPFTLATGAMTPMEEIAEKAPGRLWMQLYVWEDRKLSYELVERAKNCGFEALIVTVDTAVSPNREYNAKNGFHQPFRMTTRATLDMLTRPRWMATVLARYAMRGGLPKYENYPKHLQHSIRTDPNVNAVMRRDSLSWEDIKIFRKMWPGILMVKGINRPDDALRAAEHGCDGIVVSNHGGRNMDSAVASIDALPEIADAVGEKATVLLDSGVRRGSDIAKALALGAKAVLTGRATLYGTSVGGQAGAAKAIGVIRKELDNTMVYCGCNTVEEITPDILFAPRGTNSAASLVG